MIGGREGPRWVPCCDLRALGIEIAMRMPHAGDNHRTACLELDGMTRSYPNHRPVPVPVPVPVRLSRIGIPIVSIPIVSAQRGLGVCLCGEQVASVSSERVWRIRIRMRRLRIGFAPPI